MDSANKDGTGNGIRVNVKITPEVEFSRLLSPNAAAELILTYPQKHAVSADDGEGGRADISSLMHLPPTPKVQTQFTGMSGFRPCVGAGINCSNFSGAKLPAGLGIDHSSWGLAAQLGADIRWAAVG